MRSFRDTPIKRKLIAMSLLSSGAALLLACGGFVAYELKAYREATLNQLTSVAAVIAANSSAALSFDDPESAEQTLSALRSERMVVAGCIYAADGKSVAAYYHNDQAGALRVAARCGGEGAEAVGSTSRCRSSAEGDSR